MRGRHFFSLILATLVWACGADTISSSEEKRAANELLGPIGNWGYRGHFEGVNLDIRSNHEFLFQRTGCTYSECALGVWKMEDSLLILNSFPQAEPQAESETDLGSDFPPLDVADTIFFDRKTYVIRNGELLLRGDDNAMSLSKFPDTRD